MTATKRRQRSRRHQQETIPGTPFWTDPAGVSPAVFLLTCMVFVGGLVLGGSGGSIGDTVVQLMALPLIVLATMQWTQSPLRGPDWIALCIIAGLIVLAAVQLAPLPLAWWTALPGRAELFQQLQSVGAAPARTSLSLNPTYTERALQWTLPAIGMFLAVRWMSLRQRRVLLWVLFVGAIGITILGIALHGGAPIQELSVGEMFAKMNPLAPAPLAVAKTNVHSDTFAGLFSNRNHFGTFLAMTIPLAAATALMVWLERNGKEAQAWIPGVAALGMLIVVLLLAAVDTRSRAALLLAGLALLGSLALLWRIRMNRIVAWSIVACCVVGTVAAIVAAGSATLARLDRDPGSDARWQIHATTLAAARHFGPLGSGLGTFVQAYQAVSPEKDVRPQYINRAHSDYHELWLETGYPGIVLIAGFFAWLAWSTWRAWTREPRTSLVARAAALSLGLLLAHSYVDYPLRKTAILVEFGLCCALLSPSAGAASRQLESDKRPARAT